MISISSLQSMLGGPMNPYWPKLARVEIASFIIIFFISHVIKLKTDSMKWP